MIANLVTYKTAIKYIENVFGWFLENALARFWNVGSKSNVFRFEHFEKV